MATLLRFHSVCRIHTFMGLFIQILFKLFPSLCFCAAQWGQSCEISIASAQPAKNAGMRPPAGPSYDFASCHGPAESVPLRHTAL